VPAKLQSYLARGTRERPIRFGGSAVMSNRSVEESGAGVGVWDAGFPRKNLHLAIQTTADLELLRMRAVTEQWAPAAEPTWEKTYNKGDFSLMS